MQNPIPDCRNSIHWIPTVILCRDRHTPDGARLRPVFPARMCRKERPKGAEKPRRQACSTGRRAASPGLGGTPTSVLGISKRIFLKHCWPTFVEPPTLRPPLSSAEFVLCLASSGMKDYTMNQIGKMRFYKCTML